MTNLVFYKEEIWDILMKRLQHSSEESAVYSSLTECYKKHTDATVVRLIDLISWACEEHKEPILTEEEKEYLNAVIKSLKGRIKYISKEEWGYNREAIRIVCDDVVRVALHDFKKDTIYKGMKLGKEYTLKELGL